jgi:hypothetical protein
MRMPWKAGRIACGIVIAEVVEQKERVEFGWVLKAERAVKVYARPLACGNGLTLFQNGSDGHGKSPLRQHIGSVGAVEMVLSVHG